MIDHAGSYFFLNPLFHYCKLQKVTGSAQARKQYARTKTCFSFKIKDRIILFELEGILKNNLRLFKLDSKTLLVYHSAIMSTK